MIQTAIDKWSAWPTWAKWTSGIGAVVLVEAVMVASGERDFAAALVQHIAALILRYGMIALAIGGGWWVGVKVAKRWKPWIGWVAGIAFGLAVVWFGIDAIAAIPGVGDRVMAMGGGCSVEWDGRSNPTVC